MAHSLFDLPESWLKRFALILLALFFVVAGANHFINPDFYLRMMPPWLPAHEALNDVSGFFEVLGGVGVLIPATRRYAGWGLVALLVAIFPANIHMAMNPGDFPELSKPILYSRLPFQLAFIGWVYWATIAGRGSQPEVVESETSRTESQ